MPEIDVTDVLVDPMVGGERFRVIRRAQSVDGFGEPVIGRQIFDPVFGSVTPIGENSLLREEAFQSQAKTIRVVTPFKLRGMSKDPAGREYQPDIVMWRGDHYIVRTLQDFSQFGAGMIDAECTSIDYVDQAPRLGPMPVSS